MAEQNKPTLYIMLLNDGETFTDLKGCAIYQVPEDWSTERLEAALKEDPEEEGDEDHLLHVLTFTGEPFWEDDEGEGSSEN